MRFIVPFSPGSGSDTIARIVATALPEVLGQQVIVDNRAGAAGNIGAGARRESAAPTATHMLLVILGHAANVTLYKNLPYDLVRDFAPVTQLASTPSILVVHPSLPAKSVAELVALARAKPGAINYSSGGVGTPTFIAGELFKLHAQDRPAARAVSRRRRGADRGALGRDFGVFRAASRRRCRTCERASCARSRSRAARGCRS